MPTLLRSFAVFAGAMGILVAAGTQGRGVVGRTALALLLAWLAARIVVPRLAHRAFLRGEFRRSAFWYALLVVRIDPAARAAARISRAACRLGRADYAGALAELGEREGRLPESLRAVWLNNRAYALVKSGGDAAAALALADGAVALRPDVPGFRHTRGIALLALGRLDDAIRELDEVWRRQDEREPAPLLEAERCADLAVAWERKGESAHAADYLDRARQTAAGAVAGRVE